MKEWRETKYVEIGVPRVPEPVDMVEVVRCKDCRHYDKGACWDVDAYGRYWQEDDYCSYGKRREG